MVENLKTTKYRNGDEIPNITDASVWSVLTTGAWSYQNNDPTYGTKYGKLYNWYAVADSRNIAPVGWHVPTDPEWTILSDYLGGENVAGGKLKETGTLNWLNINSGATNETGFSGIPGGDRCGDGSFFGYSFSGFWWSTSEYNDVSIWFRYLFNDTSSIIRSHFTKPCGLSIRCIKD